MSADNDDLQCTPATGAATDERSRKTMIIDRTEGPSSIGKKAAIAVLALALLGGLAFALFRANSPSDAATASADVATRDEASGSGSAQEAVTQTATGDAPSACLGDPVDPVRVWYCNELLPFMQKASADHDRIDRLEAEVAKLKAEAGAGTSGVPLALWVILIAVGVLSVYNTVQIVRRRQERPPPG